MPTDNYMACTCVQCMRARSRVRKHGPEGQSELTSGKEA